MTPEDTDLSTVKKKKILLIEIVEDDNILKAALKERLEEEGLSVLEAEDGEKGLEYALRDKPDIIILDLALPKINGMDVLKSLREDGDWGKNVPVIILTNSVPDEKILEGITRDYPTYYLLKVDYTLDKVVEKVMEKVEGREPTPLEDL